MITFTFDVESIGLHGEGFAVGYCVHEDGREIDYATLACHPETAHGTNEGREWVRENIPGLKHDYPAPYEMRAAFWAAWRKYSAQGAIMVSDCGWPVESRFLNSCIEDGLGERDWQGPYPLYDLSSILFALGSDPKGNYTRRIDELPKHHPLADARQTARIFWDIQRGILPELEVEQTATAAI